MTHFSDSRIGAMLCIVLTLSLIHIFHAEITELEQMEESEENVAESIPADPSVRNFSFTVVNGEIYYRENSVMHKVELSVTAQNRIKGMVKIRDCTRKLIEYQLEGYPCLLYTSIMALLMCLLTIIGLLPGAAFAAQSTVTIESQTNSAFDYLEYYKDGAWKDLNTPRHWIEQTGEVVYCVEHAAGNPHGDTYTAASPSSVFSASTLSGLNSILMYGYPNNRPSGFTDDEARQATANAIRFWLSEQGEAESYSFKMCIRDRSNIPIPQAHETDCQFNMFAYPKKQCHLHSLLTIINLWRYGIMATKRESYEQRFREYQM